LRVWLDLLAAGGESYIYGPDGAPIEQIAANGTVQYLHHDQIGSTRLITDASGNVLGTFTYNPYGTLEGEQTSGAVDQPLLGYADQYTDPTTGLIYMQARWYDPMTGQFMVVDPKVESTWMPYAYADDDPITNTDPTGEMAPPCRTVKSCDAWRAQLRAWDSSGGISLKDLALVAVNAFGDEDGLGELYDAISASAAEEDSYGLSAAARSLQKHAAREGSVYTDAGGTMAERSAAAQDIVDDILTDPASSLSVGTTGRFGVVVDIQSSATGYGLRWSPTDGSIGFLEPPGGE
jgi:RHS repeat-associated protein